ncbi:hypothetical protein DPEC_G00192420 [Dallia pectoralis]|uniref:Uncharacterized protein n=1 Tax=Dallia pectoralis TaxID=75939 RepID=A0ACC2GC78_DALPE|nr:hypothetical protein DPEC_G00192420 [Dallia pectoralis]
MKSVILLMSLFGYSSAVPVPESESNEVAAHAINPQQWMELYRMYTSLAQQGLGAEPASPNADKDDTIRVLPPVGPVRHVHHVFYQPQAAHMNSDEEAPVPHYGGYYPYPGQAVKTAPLNSDEVEEDAAREEAEAAELEAAELEAAEPEAAEPEPAGVNEPVVEPAAVKLAGVKPIVVEPAVVEPAVVEPAVVEPAVADTITDLEAAAPEATKDMVKPAADVLTSPTDSTVVTG